MDQVLKIDENSEKGVIDFLKFLLQNNKLSGVFTLRKMGKKGSFDYALITESELLKDAIPLHPFMPVNAGKMLSVFTPMKKPVAAVIKPCELRAFIELVKRSQATLDNFLLISYTCGGSFTFNTTLEDHVDKLLPDYWKAMVNGDDFGGIRPTCKACEYFVPMSADITISLIGEKDTNSTCKMFLHSDKSKSMAEGFKAEMSEDELDQSKFDSIVKKRKEQKEKIFREIKIQDSGLDGMIDVFGKCIGCHGCNRVCPICYCILCDFESHHFDYEASLFESQISQKGALRLPPDTILYQLGRLTHMSYSCVGCGLCTEVCPVDIPVATIFKKTGEETAKIYDYVSGRDVEEPVPVTVFKEDELSEFCED